VDNGVRRHENGQLIGEIWPAKKKNGVWLSANGAMNSDEGRKKEDRWRCDVYISWADICAAASMALLLRDHGAQNGKSSAARVFAIIKPCANNVRCALRKIWRQRQRRHLSMAVA
jgi:hypothetical protein